MLGEFIADRGPLDERGEVHIGREEVVVVRIAVRIGLAPEVVVGSHAVGWVTQPHDPFRVTGSSQRLIDADVAVDRPVSAGVDCSASVDVG